MHLRVSYDELSDGRNYRFEQRKSFSAFRRGEGLDRIVKAPQSPNHDLHIITKLQLQSAPRDGTYLEDITSGIAKSLWPGRASLFLAPFGACFPSTPSSGRGKIPSQLLIILGGHGQRPTPTRAFVFSNYNLSGKLLKTGTEAELLL